jgi:hypothetical protein
VKALGFHPLDPKSSASASFATLAEDRREIRREVKHT